MIFVNDAITICLCPLCTLISDDVISTCLKMYILANQVKYHYGSWAGVPATNHDR